MQCDFLAVVSTLNVHNIANGVVTTRAIMNRSASYFSRRGAAHAMKGIRTIAFTIAGVRMHHASLVEGFKRKCNERLRC